MNKDQCVSCGRRRALVRKCGGKEGVCPMHYGLCVSCYDRDRGLTENVIPESVLKKYPSYREIVPAPSIRCPCGGFIDRTINLRTDSPEKIAYVTYTVYRVHPDFSVPDLFDYLQGVGLLKDTGVQDAQLGRKRCRDDQSSEVEVLREKLHELASLADRRGYESHEPRYRWVDRKSLLSRASAAVREHAGELVFDPEVHVVSSSDEE